MARVVLDGISKRFGDVEAVKDLDLEVRDHEFLVLLGPSGCGKTTALRLIAGLETPTDGTVRIGERVVNDVEPSERDVAMVFQSYALYPHMSAFRNIEFPLKSRRVPRQQRRALVSEAAGALGLGDLLDRRPRELSGGQRQRVALARAIVRRPLAFLMDEPLSNLDAKLRSQTRTDLIEMQRRLGTTIVYVTHDQVEGMTMGHRVAVIDGGVLQQLGPPADVYSRPANLFVAGFIGTPPMNVLGGHPVSVGDDVAVDTRAGRIERPRALQAALVDSGAVDVTVGVRPEHLRLGGSGGLRADVVVTEALGYEQHVVCRLTDGTTVIVRLLGEAAAPRDGETVDLEVDGCHLHLFDGGTGWRIGP